MSEFWSPVCDGCSRNQSECSCDRDKKAEKIFADAANAEREYLLAVLKKAEEVCMWIGWMDKADLRAIHAVQELKDEIEKYTGKEIMEYS